METNSLFDWDKYIQDLANGRTLTVSEEELQTLESYVNYASFTQWGLKI